MSEVIRLKVKHGLKGYIPQTFNFSDIPHDHGNDNRFDELEGFDPGDEGDQLLSVEESVDFEKMVLQVLFNLNQREKIIFLYQMLRDNGFQIDHGSFAQTLSISRVEYMNILKNVKLKTFFVVKGKSLLSSLPTNKSQRSGI